MDHAWSDKLAFSMGSRERFDMELLMPAIPGCVNVVKTDEETDKRGVDYIATLRRGAQVLIDAKTREAGASRFWNGEPELALEVWSVVPTQWASGKVGWTLSESSPVDMILYTFDRRDTDAFYLLPFQFLRMAFRRNLDKWQKLYPLKEQSSDGGRWKSLAMFAPSSVVIKAVAECMRGSCMGVGTYG